MKVGPHYWQVMKAPNYINLEKRKHIINDKGRTYVVVEFGKKHAKARLAITYHQSVLRQKDRRERRRKRSCTWSHRDMIVISLCFHRDLTVISL